MVEIIALDQKIWIEIAIAWKTQDKSLDQALKFKKLVNLVSSGRAKFPLTFSNIYETFKVSDYNRRRDLAYVQSVLSRGLFFVGRHQQRQAEIEDFLRGQFKLPLCERDDSWYLSQKFWETVIPTQCLIEDIQISEDVATFVGENPSHALFSYLTGTDEDRRRAAVQKFSAGMTEILRSIQIRREKVQDFSLSMRRKILSAIMFLENQEHFWAAVTSIGLADEAILNGPDSLKRDFIRKVPCFFIERELALKLESENTILTENDGRDILFMSTVLPYSDIVIVEKPFAQRAIQAGLDQVFSTHVTSDLSGILTS